MTYIMFLWMLSADVEDSLDMYTWIFASNYINQFSKSQKQVVAKIWHTT